MGENRYPFSVNQVLFQRNNPDNSIITPSRVIGFAGTIDVSALGTSQDITIKLDDGAEDTNTVSLAAVVDDEAATVAELVTAINAAGFTDITASEDSSTGRLLIAYSGAGSPTYIQVYDDGTGTLCQVMEIGQGFGAKLLVKDQVLSSGASANIKDKEEIETENGKGEITSVEFPSKLKGYDTTPTLQVDDLELKALLTGGTYDAAADQYKAPSQNAEAPSFSLQVFRNLYKEGTNKLRDFVSVSRVTYYSGTAAPGDVSADAKAWGSVPYSCSFLDYTDPSTGEKIGPYVEDRLSVAAFNAIDWDSI